MSGYPPGLQGQHAFWLRKACSGPDHKGCAGIVAGARWHATRFVVFFAQASRRDDHDELSRRGQSIFA
eukprot:12898708-Prorocentrum_lima.AAC.1